MENGITNTNFLADCFVDCFICVGAEKHLVYKNQAHKYIYIQTQLFILPHGENNNIFSHSLSLSYSHFHLHKYSLSLGLKKRDIAGKSADCTIAPLSVTAPTLAPPEAAELLCG